MFEWLEQSIKSEFNSTKKYNDYIKIINELKNNEISETKLQQLNINAQIWVSIINIITTNWVNNPEQSKKK